ncbi:NAD(P)-binding protein [Trametopsis cervina]|nr:NAD(P)-binding protein [Trametopsis cervina]
MPTITDSKCILIIGATSGIGRALALAIHSLPSQPTVLIGGRRQERIDELCKGHERIRGARVDVMGGREEMRAFVEKTVGEYPELDAVMFASGIQHPFNFSKPDEIDLDLVEAEFTTNYVSILTLLKFFIPHFLKLSEQGRPSFIIPVTSNLAIVPAPHVPDYCATKAALHSLSFTLDKNLKDTNVHVMEILPPLTESELHDHQGTRERLSKSWMPLDAFTEEAMAGLCRGDFQIPVGNAKDTWYRFERGKNEELNSPQRKV